jgi:WD40 repeat protein
MPAPLQTRRVACNINKPFNFSSVGDDGMLRLWDRRTSNPLQTHVAHDSWCTRLLVKAFALHIAFILFFLCDVLFARCFGLAINPFHDQLTVHPARIFTFCSGAL